MCQFCIRICLRLPYGNPKFSITFRYLNIYVSTQKFPQNFLYRSKKNTVKIFKSFGELGKKIFSNKFLPVAISPSAKNSMIWSMYKHLWWWLGFDPCTSILDEDYWDLIHVQASLMMIIGIWSMSKLPWSWWLGFNQHPSILDNDWDLIHVQASLMIIIGILSTSEHPWWWWLGFYQHPSILEDDYWDLIHVSRLIFW